MKCYLYNRCKAEHDKADKRFTEKLYFVGKLFKSPICAHCIMRLIRLAEPTPTDGSVYEMNNYRTIHPEYAAIIDEHGLDKVRHELNCSMVEANPSDLPTRPEQVENYPPVRPNIVVE